MNCTQIIVCLAILVLHCYSTQNTIFVFFKTCIFLEYCASKLDLVGLL
jgi:hypothetical protein